MTKKTEAVAQAEELIRSVLERHFNQKVDRDTLRSAAQKVAESLPPERPSEGGAKRAA